MRPLAAGLVPGQNRSMSPDQSPFESQQAVEAGRLVRILDVASCAAGLPDDDQARLRGLVGALRPVARIDQYGFIWLSFDADCARDDFCLMAAEVGAP
jgi:hypothetical protein